MERKNKQKNVQQTGCHTGQVKGPRLAGAILHDYLKNSNEPLAVAYREHYSGAGEQVDTNLLFDNIFPHTELDVDLKLLTLQPRRVRTGEFLAGMLTRDGEDHYCFVENASKKRRMVTRRSPRVFKGKCINVHEREDGTHYVTLNRPRFTADFTFKHFCLRAAEELLTVAGLVEE